MATRLAAELAQDRCDGGAGAGQVGAPHDVGAQRGHDRRGARGLVSAGVVEVDVELALDPLLAVGGGLAVPEQDQGAAHAGSRGVLGPVASAGSSMTGQSRQSRSRA